MNIGTDEDAPHNLAEEVVRVGDEDPNGSLSSILDHATEDETLQGVYFTDWSDGDADGLLLKTLGMGAWVASPVSAASSSVPQTNTPHWIREAELILEGVREMDREVKTEEGEREEDTRTEEEEGGPPLRKEEEEGKPSLRKEDTREEEEEEPSLQEEEKMGRNKEDMSVISDMSMQERQEEMTAEEEKDHENATTEPEVHFGMEEEGGREGVPPPVLDDNPVDSLPKSVVEEKHPSPAPVEMDLQREMTTLLIGEDGSVLETLIGVLPPDLFLHFARQRTSVLAQGGKRRHVVFQVRGSIHVGPFTIHRDSFTGVSYRVERDRRSDIAFLPHPGTTGGNVLRRHRRMLMHREAR